ncbi:MAG: flagellar export chaperone FliS [Legionellales bacterium]
MYQEIGKYSEALGASSHKQIDLILAKAKTDIRGAIQAIEQQDILTKCKLISNANSIVVYLQSCVRTEAVGSEVEGELAQRLNGVFGHLEEQLLKANISSSLKNLRAGDQSSTKILKECDQIIVNIHAWWEKVVELQ